MTEKEIQKCIARLIEAGVHQRLGMSPKDYALLFVTRENINFSDHRFNLPVLVDPRIGFEDLLSLAGIKNYLEMDSLAHISSEILQPYIFFTHDALKYASITSASAIENFAADEEGCTLQEVIFFYLFYPHLFEGIAIDAIQTFFRGDYHHSIIKVTPYAEIGAHWHNDLTGGMHILSKGKKVYIFGRS